MALIWRAVMHTDVEIVGSAPTLFADWLRTKLAEPALRLPDPGDVLTVGDGCEVRVHRGDDGAHAGFQATLYEPRATEGVRTTVTALHDGDSGWAWIDLERWSDDAFSPTWLPYAPGIAGAVIKARTCRRGPVAFEPGPVLARVDGGRRLAELLADPDRDVPVVVVAPTREELEAPDLGAARHRARELARRLAGIAPVYILGRGAVSSLSATLLLIGPDLDVHSGSVRTYLPGVGGEDDRPGRHRFVPYHRLAGRPADSAAHLVGGPLLRAACNQPPPTVWRETIRALLLQEDGSDAEELLEELVKVEDARAETLAQIAQLERTLVAERESAAAAESENDGLRRRVAFLERQLRESGNVVAEPADLADRFDPEYCADVVLQVAEDLPGVAFPDSQWDDASELDAHSNPSWAKKAWRAFRALNAYARAKQDESFEGSFLDFCQRSGSIEVIPASWVALKESETTDNNPTFRGKRTLPIEAAAGCGDAVYMPAHIKLEPGGYPAPRIHFHDDTSGETRRVHVGYFGVHLDNRSTN
jgi:hypothetical protein